MCAGDQIRPDFSSLFATHLGLLPSVLNAEEKHQSPSVSSVNELFSPLTKQSIPDYVRVAQPRTIPTVTTIPTIPTIPQLNDDEKSSNDSTLADNFTDCAFGAICVHFLDRNANIIYENKTCDKDSFVSIVDSLQQEVLDETVPNILSKENETNTNCSLESQRKYLKNLKSSSTEVPRADDGMSTHCSSDVQEKKQKSKLEFKASQNKLYVNIKVLFKLWPVVANVGRSLKPLQKYTEYYLGWLGKAPKVLQQNTRNNCSIKRIFKSFQMAEDTYICKRNKKNRCNFSENKNDKRFSYRISWLSPGHSKGSALRNSSDLLRLDRNEKNPDSKDKNLKFPDKKLSRRNSMPHFLLDDKNKPQTTLKASRKKDAIRRASSSFDESYPSTSKTKTKLIEFSKEAAQNTIKLIDKILSKTPTSKPSKFKSQETILETAKDQNPRSSSFEKNSTALVSRGAEYVSKKEEYKLALLKGNIPTVENYKDEIKRNRKQRQMRLLRRSSSSQSSDSPEAQLRSKRRSASAMRQRPLSSYKLTATKEPMYLSSAESYLPRKAKAQVGDRIYGFSSFDSLLCDSEAQSEKRAKTDAFLRRLDTFLTDLVEQEKKKIKNFNISKSAENKSQDRISERLLASQREPPKMRQYLLPNTQNRQVRKKNYCDYDLIEQHKQCFTDKKPHKPRILKKTSQSKIIPLQCYQAPRSKRGNNKNNENHGTTEENQSRENHDENQGEIEENHEENRGITKENRRRESRSSYSDDFDPPESPRSTDDSQDVSSEQNSIDEVFINDNSPVPYNDGNESKIHYHESVNSVDNRTPFHNDAGSNAPEVAISPKIHQVNGKSKNFEDEDDTCYGSDQIGSDVMNEQVDTLKFHNQTNNSIDYGEISIDSAYTGSREATPDIYKLGSDQTLFPTGPRNKNSEMHRSASFADSRITSVQRMKDAKRFLLERIRESGLYSDSSINCLLEYYSRKWQHIPGNEMKYIITYIRKDLGVTAPPKTYIDHLLKPKTDNDTTDISTEECLTALSNTLPYYLKSYNETRKTVSSSSSPEPSALLGRNINLSNTYNRSLFAERQDFIQRFKNTETFSHRPNQQSKNVNAPDQQTKNVNAPNQQTMNVSTRMNDRALLRRRSDKSLLVSTKPNQKCYQKQENVSNETDNSSINIHSEDSDEDWIRKTVGEDVLAEVKQSITSSKDFNHRDVESEDIKKMTDDLCDQFGIVL